MVGVRLVESFRLADEFSVVAIARHPAHLALPARFAVDLRVADALDVNSLARSLAGCAAAVHVEQELVPNEARAPAVLCRAAAQAGVRRLVYLSSAGVHGQNPPPDTDERSPLHQRHAFAANNLLVGTERQFLAESRQHNLPAYALRPAVLYGPRSPLVAGLVSELLESRACLLQNGEGICNSLYIDNLVDAIRLCLKSRHGAGQPYLLRDAETVTWRDFYQALGRGLDLPAKGFHMIGKSASTGADAAGTGCDSPRRPAPDPWDLPRAPEAEITLEMAEWQRCTWQLPYTRATRELGYKPAVSFAEGIRRTCDWWRFAQGYFPAAA
jgi:2-alkyl-3-oxoalkanoate reductase